MAKVFLIQGHIDRAQEALKMYEPGDIFITVSAQLMRNVSWFESEAYKCRQFLIDEGIPRKDISSKGGGEERLGSLLAGTELLEEVVKDNSNITELVLPIESIYKDNYISLLNYISQDVRTKNKLPEFKAKEMKKNISPFTHLSETMIKYSIRKDISKRIVDLADRNSVKRYVQRLYSPKLRTDSTYEKVAFMYKKLLAKK